MRMTAVKRTTILLAGLAILNAAPSAAQKGGASPAPAPVNNPAEFAKATQCAGLYQFMAEMIPPSAPQRAQIDMRLSIWLDYAAKANPLGRATAQSEANLQEQGLSEKLASLSGDEAGFAATMAPLNTQCENAPPATVPPPAPVQRVTRVSESTMRASEGKMECAGLHRYYEGEGVGGPLFNGNSKLFLDAIVRDRPDLSAQAIEQQVENRRQKWADANKKATDDYVAALRRGETAAPKLPDGLIELAEECDGAANFLK